MINSRMSSETCCEQENRGASSLCRTAVQAAVGFLFAGAEEGFPNTAGLPAPAAALPSGFTTMLLFLAAHTKDVGTCLTCTVSTVPGPNKKCLSTALQPHKQAAAGWERRACQLRAPEKVFRGSYLQPSKELQRLPIKTLLKHFWCCQQWRAEIAQWSLRCYLPQAVQWYCQ